MKYLLIYSIMCNGFNGPLKTIKHDTLDNIVRFKIEIENIVNKEDRCSVTTVVAKGVKYRIKEIR